MIENTSCGELIVTTKAQIQRAMLMIVPVTAKKLITKNRIRFTKNGNGRTKRGAKEKIMVMP